MTHLVKKTCMLSDIAGMKFYHWKTKCTASACLFGRVGSLAIKKSIPFGWVNFTTILVRWALAALTKQEYETDNLVAAGGGGFGPFETYFEIKNVEFLPFL